MDVQLHARRMVGPDDAVEILRRHVPESVRRAVVVAGRQQTGGEPLDRTVHDDLDDPEAQRSVLAFRSLAILAIPSSGGQETEASAGTIRTGSSSVQASR